MLKNHKSKIIAGIIVIISLIVAFFVDGEMPYNKNVDKAMTDITLSSPEPTKNEIEQPQNETPAPTQNEPTENNHTKRN